MLLLLHRLAGLAPLQLVFWQCFGLIVGGLLFFVGPARAQQNLFNIPAGDLTPKNKFFFQQQVNILGRQDIESKSHLVYGLGRGWEVGINVINVKMDFRRRAEFFNVNDCDLSRPMKPLLQATGQKFFVFNDKFSTSIGTQFGVNPVRLSGESRLTHFTYNTWMYEPWQHVKFVAGPYVSDRGTVGYGNQVGMLLGFEAPLAKKWILMADIITGTNANAVSVIGFNYLATKRVQLCLGAMLPNPGSRNSQGIVFELNLLGYDDHEEQAPALH